MSVFSLDRQVYHYNNAAEKYDEYNINQKMIIQKIPLLLNVVHNLIGLSKELLIGYI